MKLEAGLRALESALGNEFGLEMNPAGADQGERSAGNNDPKQDALQQRPRTHLANGLD